MTNENLAYRVDGTDHSFPTLNDAMSVAKDHQFVVDEVTGWHYYAWHLGCGCRLATCEKVGVVMTLDGCSEHLRLSAEITTRGDEYSASEGNLDAWEALVSVLRELAAHRGLPT